MLVINGPHASFEQFGRIPLRSGRHRSSPLPNLWLVGFADGDDFGQGHAEEPRCELAGCVRGLLVDNRGGGGDTDRLANAAPTEAAESANQACGLGSVSAGERMSLVADQVVQSSSGKELDIALACEQQLKLFHVGEQNARRIPRLAHHLPGAELLGWVHRFAALLAAHFG